MAPRLKVRPSRGAESAVDFDQQAHYSRASANRLSGFDRDRDAVSLQCVNILTGEAPQDKLVPRLDLHQRGVLFLKEHRREA